MLSAIRTESDHDASLTAGPRSDRSLARGFPELSVKRTHPSLSDGFAPVQSVARRAPQDHGLIVDTLHKQGMMVLAKSELPWAGGKKS